MKDLIKSFPKEKNIIKGLFWLEEKLKTAQSPYALANEIVESLSPYEKIMKKPSKKWTFLMKREVKILNDLGIPPLQLTKREFTNFCIHIDTLFLFAKYIKVLNVENDSRFDRILKALMIENFTNTFNFHTPGKQPNFSDLAKMIKRTFTNKTLLNELSEIANNITCGQVMTLADQFGITRENLVDLLMSLAKNTELTPDSLAEIRDQMFSNDESIKKLTLKELKESFGITMNTTDLFDTLFNSKTMNLNDIS